MTVKSCWGYAFLLAPAVLLAQTVLAWSLPLRGDNKYLFFCTIFLSQVFILGAWVKFVLNRYSGIKINGPLLSIGCKITLAQLIPGLLLLAFLWLLSYPVDWAIKFFGADTIIQSCMSQLKANIRSHQMYAVIGLNIAYYAWTFFCVWIGACFIYSNEICRGVENQNYKRYRFSQGQVSPINICHQKNRYTKQKKRNDHQNQIWVGRNKIGSASLKKRCLKIVISTHYFGGIGGSERRLKSIVESLPEHEFYIFAPKVMHEGFIPTSQNYNLNVTLDKSETYDLYVYFAGMIPYYLGEEYRFEKKSLSLMELRNFQTNSYLTMLFYQAGMGHSV